MTSNPPSGSASNARSGTQASPCRITRRTVIVSTQQIEQFLLGTCEETLAVEIEERLFSDDAFYAQVQQVKTTLLHREAASTLPSETSAALARQLDRSPSLRQEFQRIREAETQHVFRFPVQGRPKSIFPWKIGLGFAAVGAVLALAAGTVLRKPHPVPHMASQTANQTASASVQQKVSAPLATILFLPAGVLRGPAGPAPFHTPDPNLPVELQIELRGSAASVLQWTATLARTGQPILTAVPTHPATVGSVHYLSLPLSAGLLTPGDYHLTLAPDASVSTSGLIERTFRLGKR